tara:strand:+ start:4060 stop:4290 length:231 start_codon:yes stop_codon:yes gene_type:complete
MAKARRKKRKSEEEPSLFDLMFEEATAEDEEDIKILSQGGSVGKTAVGSQSNNPWNGPISNGGGLALTGVKFTGVK